MSTDNKDHLGRAVVQGAALNLRDLLTPNRVIPLQTTDKGQAIEALVNCVVETCAVSPTHRAAILEAVKRREAAGSTGLFLGVAVTLGDTPLIADPICAFAFSREGIAYDALDEQPVKLIMLLLRPDHRWMEMQALTQNLRFFMAKHRNLLESASTAPELYEGLVQAGQDIMHFIDRTKNQPFLGSSEKFVLGVVKG
jgi:mannitol/fructose-specific phosphotransferase system IIA component (Ntr-type)